MFATSVGLIMRGFDYLEIYKSSFNADLKSEFKGDVDLPEVDMEDGAENDFDDSNYEDGYDGKLSWAEKFKRSLTKMFETEDQSIN
jgi:hypothetical protein